MWMGGAGCGRARISGIVSYLPQALVFDPIGGGGKRDRALGDMAPRSRSTMKSRPPGESCGDSPPGEIPSRLDMRRDTDNPDGNPTENLVEPPAREGESVPRGPPGLLRPKDSSPEGPRAKNGGAGEPGRGSSEAS
eukprot:CAMPEP_0180250932 /NCGR_PEP_ID=MMETSP0987-20121128/38158_1 /TAXON_ID=697907 /ORGANISM="non described non described, Strain CCMP2293" /LENGTH=135 /DNA_ID=CAMNT_0022219421 /DNA_START=418 /DNA_END=822 /DNA_ORIENTATION=+